MTGKIDKIFESKAFKCAVKYMVVTMWAISGLAGFNLIPATTPQAQWSYGMLFGLGLIPMSSIIAEKLFWILYNNISYFRNHVNTHWGCPNTN